MCSAKIVAVIQYKFSNEIALSIGGPYTCQYVILLQSFHRDTLSIHCYIAQNVQSTFGPVRFILRSLKTVIFSKFLKVAIATLVFMSKVHNGTFAPDSCVSILKEIIALVQSYVYGTRK